MCAHILLHRSIFRDIKEPVIVPGKAMDVHEFFDKQKLHIVLFAFVLKHILVLVRFTNLVFCPI